MFQLWALRWPFLAAVWVPPMQLLTVYKPAHSKASSYLDILQQEILEISPKKEKTQVFCVCQDPQGRSILGSHICLIKSLLRNRNQLLYLFGASRLLLWDVSSVAPSMGKWWTYPFLSHHFHPSGLTTDVLVQILQYLQNALLPLISNIYQGNSLLLTRYFWIFTTRCVLPSYDSHIHCCVLSGSSFLFVTLKVTSFCRILIQPRFQMDALVENSLDETSGTCQAMPCFMGLVEMHPSL